MKKGKKRGKSSFSNFIYSIAREPINVPNIIPCWIVLIFTFTFIVFFNYLFLIGNQYWPPSEEIVGDKVNPECNIFEEFSTNISDEKVFNISYLPRNNSNIGIVSAQNLFRLISDGPFYSGESRFKNYRKYYVHNDTKKLSIAIAQHQSGNMRYELYCITSLMGKYNYHIPFVKEKNFTVFSENKDISNICYHEQNFHVFLRDHVFEWKDVFASNEPKMKIGYTYPGFIKEHSIKTEIKEKYSVFFTSKNPFILIHDVLLGSMLEKNAKIAIYGIDKSPLVEHIINSVIDPNRIMYLKGATFCFQEISVKIPHEDPKNIPKEVFTKINDALMNVVKGSDKKVIVNGFKEIEANFVDTDALFINLLGDGIGMYEDKIISAKAFVSRDCYEAIAALLTPIDTKIYLLGNSNALSYSAQVLEASGRKVHIIDKLDTEFIRSLL